MAAGGAVEKGADIFGGQSGPDPSARQSARNRIDRKHVDFLLVRVGDFAPLAGVELDDRSHEEEERQQRDVFVDEVFAGACRCSMCLCKRPTILRTSGPNWHRSWPSQGTPEDRLV